MKPQRFIKNITLAFLMLIVLGCEKEIAPNAILQQEEDSVDHTVNRMSLTDFMNTSTFQSVEETIIKPNNSQFSYLNRGPGTADNEFEFTSSEVLSGQLNDEITYTTPIKKTNTNEEDVSHTLLIKENSEGTSSYLVTYSNTNATLLIQPIATENTTNNPPDIPDGVNCATYSWSVSTPCSCMGHTYTCLCGTTNFPGTAYSSSSGFITTCWSSPIPITLGPGAFGDSAGANEQINQSFSTGGTSTTPIEYPIYIYEGEEECFDDGTCTPPLYMPINLAGADVLGIDIVNILAFNTFISTLPQEQQDFLNDSENSEIRGNVQDFYTDNNLPEDEDFISNFIAYMRLNPNSGFELTNTPTNNNALNFANFSEAQDYLDNLDKDNYTHISSTSETGSIRRDVHSIEFNSFPQADLVTSIKATIPDDNNALECLEILNVRCILEGNTTLFDWTQFDSEDPNANDGPLVEIDEDLDRVKISIEGEMFVGLNVGDYPAKRRHLITVVITYHYSTAEINEDYCYWYYTNN